MDHPTFPVNQRCFHLIVIQGDCHAASISRQIFGIRRVYRETFFANPRASFSSPYPGGFNHWISNVMGETLVLTSTGRPVTCGERQIPDTVLTPRFQPGSSAGNSTLRREDSQRIMEQTNKDCRSRKFTLTNSPLQQHLLVGR